MPTPRIEAVHGDITAQDTDAIVNAANRMLAGGGGVDGAIHRAAGARELRAACTALDGCEPGDAKATPGFALTARWIIHTVGPVWNGGTRGEPEILASCYRRSLEVAAAIRARSVAFPAISTGVYGYPPDLAARVAVSTIEARTGTGKGTGTGVGPGDQADAAGIELVRLVAFDRATFELYQELLNG